MGKGLVDRATSDALISPDGALNLEICDFVNQDSRLVQSLSLSFKAAKSFALSLFLGDQL
jgi:hypothetical protein